MSARLLRVCLDADRLQALLEALEEEGLPVRYLGQRETGFCVEALVPADRINRVLYKVEHLATEGDLAVLLRPAWSWPTLEETESRPAIEELEARLAAEARPSPRFYLLLLGSALLAFFGLYRGDDALLVASMITAPLLAPGAALAWAGLRRDLRLFLTAALALLSGGVLSLLLGDLLARLTGAELGPAVWARVHPNLADLGLALVAGGIGVVALLGDLSTGLVGVMVALALLPPLVAAGMLLAAGEAVAAGGAMLLFGVNLASMMLAFSVGFALAFRWRVKKVAPAFLFWLLVLFALGLSRSGS